jgi:hypothetical protein
MRLIDADLLEKEIYKWMPKDQETWMSSDIPPIEDLVVSIMMTIQEQPTVDAVPVVHGKWIDIDTQTYTWKVRCDQCGYERSMMSTQGRYPKYCENCGAKMDERKEK